jgi:hypothetical protein
MGLELGLGQTKEWVLLSVFKNSVLRIIFGPKPDEVTYNWRKLRNEEIRNL